MAWPEADDPHFPPLRAMTTGSLRRSAAGGVTAATCACTEARLGLAAWLANVAGMALCGAAPHSRKRCTGPSDTVVHSRPQPALAAQPTRDDVQASYQGFVPSEDLVSCRVGEAPDVTVPFSRVGARLACPPDSDNPSEDLGLSPDRTQNGMTDACDGAASPPVIRSPGSRPTWYTTDRGRQTSARSIRSVIREPPSP